MRRLLQNGPVHLLRLTFSYDFNRSLLFTLRIPKSLAKCLIATFIELLRKPVFGSPKTFGADTFLGMLLKYSLKVSAKQVSLFSLTFFNFS